MVRIFALIECEIPDRGMDSFGIIEAGDVFEDVLACLLSRLELRQVDQFFLDYTMKDSIQALP